MTPAGRAACAALIVIAAGCEERRGDPLSPDPAAPPPPAAAPAQPLRVPQTRGQQALAAAQNAPQIYMALQPDPSGPISVIFAIDADQNDEPRNDPAIRLTPEGGKCNPQELRRYDFPPDIQRPVFGPPEAVAGVTAQDLPAFMAMAVTSEMLRRKMIGDVEESKPQNVCTRKLWERLIVNQAVLRG